MANTRLLPFGLLMFALMAGRASGQPAAPSSPLTTSSEDEQALAAELAQVLQEETEIATRTKLNADYVPGIVSVLQGDEIEKLGMRTVWEALSLVPGIETTINPIGMPIATIRGIGFDFLASHVKIMVDSIPVNQSFAGNNLPTMMMPIEQVERIEVIRGPGSVVYGEFAFSGVINVITRKQGSRVYAAGGSFDTVRAGGHTTHEDPEEKLRVTVNGAYWETDGFDAFVPSDFIRRTQPAISRAPGRAAEDEQYNSEFFSLEKDEFKLRFQRQHRDNGRYFAVRSLPPDPDLRDQEDGYYLLDASHAWALDDSLRLVAHATYNRGNRLIAEELVPPGFVQAPPPGSPPRPPAIVFPLGQRFSIYHEERRLDAGFDLSWRASKKHDLLLRVNQSDIDILENTQDANFNALTGMPLPTFRRLAFNEAGVVPPGTGRDIFSAALQDQIAVSDRLTATLGGRYDDYSDVGDSFTPRISAVWQLDQPHLLKVQYAEAFRPPNLESLNLPATQGAQQGNPGLRPQTIDTTELGYIYRKPEFVGRLTLFKSNVEDYISQRNRRQENVTDYSFRGGEAEADYKIDEDWRVMGNLAYFDYEDERNVRGLDGVAQRLANLAVMRNLGKHAVLTARLLDVGDRSRFIIDPRPRLTGYTTVDLTLSLSDAMNTKGLGFRIGARNLFDEDVKAPAMPNTYPDDLPRPGRTWWAQVSYQF